jgi:hypothetical protein
MQRQPVCCTAVDKTPVHAPASVVRSLPVAWGRLGQPTSAGVGGRGRSVRGGLPGRGCRRVALKSSCTLEEGDNGTATSHEPRSHNHSHAPRHFLRACLAVPCSTRAPSACIGRGTGWHPEALRAHLAKACLAACCWIHRLMCTSSTCSHAHAPRCMQAGRPQKCVSHAGAHLPGCLQAGGVSRVGKEQVCMMSALQRSLAAGKPRAQALKHGEQHGCVGCAAPFSWPPGLPQAIPPVPRHGGRGRMHPNLRPSTAKPKRGYELKPARRFSWASFIRGAFTFFY